MATHNEHVVLLLGSSSFLAIYSVENSILVRGDEGYKLKHIYPPRATKHSYIRVLQFILYL
jgi:hypothetical protein